MSSPGTVRFAQLASTPSTPPAGYALIYLKTDDVLYILDDGGVETPLGSSSSITSLTGDVTATGPGAAAATVVTVGGATAAAIAAVVANNTGVNSGDVTVSDTDSIDLTITGQLLSGVLRISADAASAGYIKAVATIHSGGSPGLHVEVQTDTPVQIGTTNFEGAAGKTARSDHVHDHGAQTSGTLHAAATTSVNGFMSATDKVRIDFLFNVVALTDAVTITTDASLGNTFTVTLGGNRTLGAPTNPTNGQRIVYRIRQDGTGTRTLAFDAIFRFPPDIGTIVLSTTANRVDYIGFMYNSTDTKWDCLAVTKNLGA